MVRSAVHPHCDVFEMIIASDLFAVASTIYVTAARTLRKLTAILKAQVGCVRWDVKWNHELMIAYPQAQLEC